jgi:hypothetical protein
MNRGKTLSRQSRNRTGCVGISHIRTTKKRRDGTLRSFFSVHARKPDGRAHNRKFCIETLGRHEAWRRALKFRAEHEVAIARRAV